MVTLPRILDVVDGVIWLFVWMARLRGVRSDTGSAQGRIKEERGT